jgi:hypothetical protein
MPRPEASTVIVPGSGAGVGEAEAREEVKSAIWLTGTRVLARPFALHDRDHRQLLVRQAIGLHVAQYRNPEQSRRAHRPIGLLELAGEARRCHDIASAPDLGAAALAMRDQHRLAQDRGDRCGSLTDMDHERAAAYRGAVDPFGGMR